MSSPSFLSVGGGSLRMTLLSTQIANVISSVGFPIAAFIMMWKFATTTLKENTLAINNLTLVLKKR